MGLILPRVLLEELRKRAEEAGVSAEEYLFDVLTEGYDPVEGSEKYMEGAGELLEQAEQEYRKGNLRQASEKIWGACALAVKAHALAKRHRRLESHADLWKYKDEISAELGDWIRTAFKLANLMHVNFYENLATERDVGDVLKEVEKLVKAIAGSLKT